MLNDICHWIIVQVLACNILEEHKFVLLEITEHYDTFLVKKDEASQVGEQVQLIQLLWYSVVGAVMNLLLALGTVTKF